MRFLLKTYLSQDICFIREDTNFTLEEYWRNHNSKSQLETFIIERERCGFIIERKGWGSTGKSFY